MTRPVWVTRELADGEDDDSYLMVVRLLGLAGQRMHGPPARTDDGTFGSR